jgi:phosphatidylglycerol:prolipoprotein diacylglycerol transferase
MVVQQNLVLSQLCYGLGYLTAIAAYLLMARHRRLLTHGVVGIIPVALLGGLAGGTLLQYVFGSTDGKSIIGALIVGYLCVYFYKKYIGLTRPLGDLFAVAIAAGEAVGRFGCLFAGCCYGKVTTGPLAIFQHGAERYPTQIFMAATSLVILLVLLTVEHRNVLPENGLFCLYGILYCIGRFTIEFYREGPVFIDWLTAAQFACIGGLIFYTVYLTRLTRPVLTYA